MVKGYVSKTLGLILLVLLVVSTASAQFMPGKTETQSTTATRVADEAPIYSLSDAEIYLIRLVDPPLASYDGGISGLEPTRPSVTGALKLDVDTPASQAYGSYLAQRQNEVVEAMQLRFSHQMDVVYRYNTAYNGLAVRLTGQEALEVASLPGVADVQRDFVRYPDTDAGPDWIGAPGVWDSTGTGLPATMGEGVIIGVIDTGINFDHPSFADVGGDGYDHTNPFGAGNYVGWCDSGHPDYDAGVHICNDKLVGAWDFTADGNKGEDDDGHGSHTASTAGGNVVTATIDAPTILIERSISGVAPHANIISYDTCITGDGCPGSALVAAIDQAVTDGVDVINYSIGGGPFNPWADADSLAFLAARDAGVFVATSAGNAGPGAGTMGSPANSPWLLSVGAVTHNRKFVNALTGMSGGDSLPPPDLLGQSITDGYGPAPIVHAKDYGDALCLNPFPGGTWSGEIVVCDRGEIARVEKGWNVLQGGAGGYVLANTAAESEGLSADAHNLPAVHIGYAAAQQLLPWLDSGSGHMATIAGTTIDENPSNGDVMADFSSRGPNPPVPDVLKPDVTAPGVAILAASMNGTEFESLGGTSMSSPHAAGAAALLRVLQPSWTPVQMQSAMMASSLHDNVLKEDGSTEADPLDYGAGRIDVSRAARAGLVLDVTITEYENADPSGGGDPSTLNLASLANGDCPTTCSWTRTVKSTSGSKTDWTVSIAGESPGLVVSVTPTSFSATGSSPTELEIEADTTNFNAAVDGSNGWGFAWIILESDGEITLRLPLAVKKAYTSASLLLTKEPSQSAAFPNAIVEYTIQLTNRDSISHTYSITDTLPVGVEFVEGSATGGLVYDDVNHQLLWEGEVEAGAIEYEITEVDPLPYVNLGADPYNADGICANYFADDCDDSVLSWDLGSYSYTFYGETLTEVDQSSNSMIFGPEGWLGEACSACNQFLPEPTEINQVMAGLWRDVHPGTGGQGEFYGSLFTGLLDNPDDVVFYANWHNVGQFDNPTITSTHAIAIVLDGQIEPAGRIYYIYDDITGDLTTNGFTVGVENKVGDMGDSWGYSPCLGGACISHAPFGSPPANGTTLRLDPDYASDNYIKTFTYQVRITAPAGELLTNFMDVTSTSTDPEVAAMWASADVSVIDAPWRVYLPIVIR